MKTALYSTITATATKALDAHGGGGGCCGTEKCQGMAAFVGQCRSDLPEFADYRLNELCGVIEALRSRIEELEARELVKVEVVT